jgi:polygalacturonase
LIEDCTFATGDDCVVLKSGYNEDGWRVGRPTENVIMRRCSSRHGHGGLVIGSEMSGSVSNVFMEDCTFDGTDRAIRIKSKRGRGGVVENVFARNLHVRNMQREVVILNMDYGSDKQPAANEKPPVFRRMAIENITAEGAPTAILIAGLADSPITDIQFGRLTIASKKGVVASHMNGLTFDRVAVRPATGPVFDLTDAANITIRRAVAPAGTSVFLKLSGARSVNVRVSDCDLTAAQERVAVSDGAALGAVTFTQP